MIVTRQQTEKEALRGARHARWIGFHAAIGVLHYLNHRGCPLQPDMPSAPIVRFSVFELDLRARELRKHGLKIKLQDQPLQILVMLLEQPGQVVTREELHRKLWSDGTFVDFEHGLNAAIQRLRQALGDAAENPRFVETVARRGYRFLAPVHGEASESTGVTPQLAQAVGRSHVILAWALVLALSVALGVLAAIHLHQPRSEAHVVRFELQPDTVSLPLAFAAGGIPAVSPNGQRLVFPAVNGKGRLWIRSLDSPTVQPLPEGETVCYPFWSPDSRFVGYYAYVTNTRVEIKKIDVRGGSPVTLCNFRGEDAEGGGTWSQDGIILFAQHGTLHRVSAAGGEAKPVLQLDKSRQEMLQKFPCFLPDGRHFVYRSRSAAAGKSGIYLGSLDSPETRMLIPGESNVSYAPPGFLIYGRQDTLLAQPFDIKKLQLAGEPFPIAENVARAIGMPISLFSVSQNGVLLYRSAGFRKLQLAWYDRSGVRQASIGVPGTYVSISLTPDETRLALDQAEPFTQTLNIWTLDLSSGMLTRQTRHPASEWQPVWSPDGREFVFSSDRDNHPKRDLYRKVVGETGEQLLFESHSNKVPLQWLRDGSILFLDDDEAFYLLPLSGERKPMLLFKPGYELGGARVSSDGHWVAFESQASGRWEIYIAAFPAFTEQQQISNGGGCGPKWRKDGKELFYIGPERKMMSLNARAGVALKTGVPKVLFQIREPYPYSVTGDGKRFIFLEPADEPRTPFMVVLNWAAGLKR